MPELSPSRTVPTVGLYPGGLLKTRQILEVMGWGDAILFAARQSGLVKPIPVGRELCYWTSELLAWVATLPRK